jgi:hypothetical protein
MNLVEKKTTLNIAKDILGDSEEINNYQKFKRLTRAYPENKNFKRNLDVALAKLQTAVSRGHNKLKSELENIQNPVLHVHENKRKAEILMKYWGVYYY